jgi:hypothetical protein
MVVLRDSILDDALFHPLFYLYLYHSISLGLGRIIPDGLCSIKYRVIGIRQNYDDVIVAPVSIIPAPLFNEQTVSIGSKTILQTREALLRNTFVFNNTRLTAVIIPIGFTRNGLPIGGQIIGPRF